MKRSKIKHSRSNQVFYIFNTIFWIIFMFLIIYPLYLVCIASVSDPDAIVAGKVIWHPVDFSLIGYKAVLEYTEFWSSYRNSFIYTISSVVISIIVTLTAAYSLSRKDLPGRKIIMFLFIFTMYFSGGMIPYYLVVKGLGLVNSRTLMILSGAVSVYNIIIARSFLEANIPEELKDAASIDGCGNARFFAQIVIPLSKAVIAVIALYLAVSYWNSYFNAMIFLTDTDKYPLQLYLRQILLTVSESASMDSSLDPQALIQLQQMGQVIKYGVIVVATVPIICVYPFIQKYFVKGVMIGSVKG